MVQKEQVTNNHAGLKLKAKSASLHDSICGTKKELPEPENMECRRVENGEQIMSSSARPGTAARDYWLLLWQGIEPELSVLTSSHGS